MLKDLKMGEIKLGFYIFNILGYTAWVAGIMANIENAKSDILFLFGVGYAVYAIIEKHQNFVKKRDDLREAKRERDERRRLNNPKSDNKL